MGRFLLFASRKGSDSLLLTRRRSFENLMKSEKWCQRLFNFGEDAKKMRHPSAIGAARGSRICFASLLFLFLSLVLLLFFVVVVVHADVRPDVGAGVSDVGSGVVIVMV